MQWTKVLCTAMLGLALLLSGEVPRVEALQCSNNLLHNSGFESGNNGEWRTSFSGAPPNWHPLIGNWGTALFGVYNAWLQGHGAESQDVISQNVTIPAGSFYATLSFYLQIRTMEAPDRAWDSLTVKIVEPRYPGDEFPPYTVLGTYTNMDAPTHSSYRYHSFDVTRFRGKSIVVRFEGLEDKSLPTSFLIDNVILTTASWCPPFGQP